MALGRIAGRGGRAAQLGLGDEKTPPPSPCCSVSVGMLPDCDISQSLLASCGSRLIVLPPRAAPLCPLLGQLFAPAAHPSNLKQPCLKDTSCSAPGGADLFSPLDLGTVFAERLGTWGHLWGHGDIYGDISGDISALQGAAHRGRNPPSPAQPRVSPQNHHPEPQVQVSINPFSLCCQLYPIGKSIKRIFFFPHVALGFWCHFQSIKVML